MRSARSVRAASASALARIGIGNLPGLGKQALADRSLAVRLAGVELLAAANADADLAALAADADPMVALQATIAVKAKHPELVDKAVARATAADEWTIRAGAANLLVTALGGGGVFLYLRRQKGSEAPPGAGTSKVISIPTVEMVDEPDSGAP